MDNTLLCIRNLHTQLMLAVKLVNKNIAIIGHVVNIHSCVFQSPDSRDHNCLSTPNNNTSHLIRVSGLRSFGLCTFE